MTRKSHWWGLRNKLWAELSVHPLANVSGSVCLKKTHTHRYMSENLARNGFKKSTRIILYIMFSFWSFTEWKPEMLLYWKLLSLFFLNHFFSNGAAVFIYFSIIGESRACLQTTFTCKKLHFSSFHWIYILRLANKQKMLHRLLLRNHFFSSNAKNNNTTPNFIQVEHICFKGY